MAENEGQSVDRNKWIDTNADLPNMNGDPVDVDNSDPQADPVQDPIQSDPIIEPNAEPASQADFAAQFKAEFGDTDLKTLKEKYAQYEAANTEFSTIKQEYETLKTKPPVAPYKTNGVEKIDEWLSKGIPLKTIARFGDMDIKTLTEDDAIKLMSEIKNPAWQSKHIEADFNSKYIHEADELKSEEANQIAQDLKEAAKLRDAAEAKAFLADYLGKQFNPSGVLEEQKAQEQAARQQLSTFWTGQGNVLTSNTKQVNNELVFKVQGEKGEEEIKLPVSFVVPENDLNQLRDMALSAAINSNIEPTETGMKQVQAYLQDLVWAKHGKSIVNAAVQDALTAQNKAFQKLIHNPTIAATVEANRSNSVEGREAQWRQNLKGRNS